MLEFQEKRKIKKYLYSRVTLVFLVIGIALLSNAVWGVYKKQDMTKDNLDKVATSLESLRGREAMLQSEIDRLQTQSGIEEEVREKYGLIKPGEEVIIMVNKEGGSDSALDDEKADFWQKVKEWFK